MIKNGIPIMNRILIAYPVATPFSCKAPLQVGHADSGAAEVAVAINAKINVRYRMTFTIT